MNPTAAAGIAAAHSMKGHAMKASDTYGAQPIKLDTFNDNITAITGYITAIERKQFDNGYRLVATLDDDWSLVLNATSYRVVRAKYGDETDEWIGRPLTAYKGTLYYRGNEQDGICVRIPDADPPPKEKVPVTADLLEGSGDEIKDDTPF